jgi:hypothetical protein
MNKTFAIGILMCMLLIVTACSAPLADEDHGFIPMAPYVNKDLGIRTVAPVGWQQVDAGFFVRGAPPEDFATYQVIGFPGLTMEEMVTTLLEQSPLDELPTQVESLPSPALVWEMFTIELPVPEIGVVWAKAALAEDDAGAYVVSVQTLREQYEEESALYEMLFNYALYNTRPIQ